MDPFTTWLAKRGARWWLANRPFSDEKRALRKKRRDIREENRRRKRDGLPPLEEPQMLNFIAKLRTSTKSGVVGFLPVILVMLPFHDQAEAFLQQACTSENGPLVFLVGAGVTWVAMFASARASKTPKDPGVL